MGYIIGMATAQAIQRTIIYEPELWAKIKARGAEIRRAREAAEQLAAEQNGEAGEAQP